MKTALVFKKRVPKKRRAAWLAVIQKTYPDAADDGRAVVFDNAKRDSKPVWLFLYGHRTFTTIETR